MIGRDSELAVLHEFLAGGRPLQSLVLAGDPGIGKTTIWEAGVELARARGLRVLAAHPTGAEAQLSFAALIDLLDGVDVSSLAGLPAPQVRALEVALLRAEPGRARTEPHAVAVAFLGALRVLAEREPVVVAIDDVQWLDSPSADVLAFAARRLEASAVAFLLARRPGRPLALEDVLAQHAPMRLDVVALSLGAIRHLLAERFALTLPRHLLRRIVDTTLGNPLFALEVGRTLAEQGVPAIGEELPVPDAVEDLLGLRVARLAAPVRRAVLAVALSGELRVPELTQIVDAGVLDDAVDAGVLRLDGDRVRASHPLLAAAARARSGTRARRELQLELARVAADEELRARHLALATPRPDDAVAAVVAAAAAHASARGARLEAVELGEHALRLTPASSDDRSARLLALAGDLVLAGEPRRATELLLPEVDALPPGPVRAQALVILAGGAVKSNEEVAGYFERALVESGGDPALHASVLARLAANMAVIRVAQIADAEAWALQALEDVRGTDGEHTALYALAWARALGGKPIDEVCARFAAAEGAVPAVTSSPERVAGQRLFWRGEVGAARAVLERLLAVSDERGEPYSYALLRLHMCQLEQRVGDWPAATRVLDEWAADREVLTWPMYERSRALVAAGRGLPDEAERWAGETVARADETGNRWDRLEALRARGLAALLRHDSAGAAASLRDVWGHTEREGVADPGVFPVAPALVEALADLGDLDAARAVTARLASLAEEQDHPWARACATQSDALVRLASDRDDDTAPALLEAAASAFDRLGLRGDHARALVLLGRAQRRRRKWAAARSALERAATSLDELGAPGWAEDARSELARVGGRRSAPSGELTPAEQRVAELAADGLANKEIAQALYVEVRTVEVHLSNVYAKLGVRSRSQLAARVSRGGAAS